MDFTNNNIFVNACKQAMSRDIYMTYKFIIL